MKILKFIIPILVLGVLAVIVIGNQGKKAEEGGVAQTGEGGSLTEILGKAQGIATYKYDTVVTTPDQTVMTTKFWLKGDKLRWEGSYAGESVVYLIDGSTQVAYLYNPAQNLAMEMNFAEAQGAVGEAPAEQAGSIESLNPTNLGTEVLDGKNCTVVEYGNEAGETKMWIWTEYGIPIRTESTTTEGTTVVEIKNIDFGDISDSMFELPAGAQMMEIPSFGF
jgi:outer membrane lipoprotein-sorting protein